MGENGWGEEKGVAEPIAELNCRINPCLCKDLDPI